MDRGLKITLIILLIILLAMISFVGLFVQDTKFMKNLLPDYQLGMDFEGYRAVTINVSDATETIYYDAEGNVVSSEDEDGTSETVPVNGEDVLTLEKYEEAKKIIKSRLKDYGVSEYLIRLDEETGSMTVELPENTSTDVAVQYVYTKGEFTMEDEDGNILLSNDDIDSLQVGYSATSTTGTTVYLTFNFKKEAHETLREITNTYVTTTDEDGEEVEKTVSLLIDGSSLLETSFDEEIANGSLILTIGTATDNDTLSSYLEQASNIAILLNSGALPIEYTLDQNRYIESDIELSDFIVPIIIVAVILFIALVVLIVRYKKLGILGIISFIGYMAILLIVIRYTNLVITMEGIFGILISAILYYIVLVNILQTLKNKEKDLIEYKNAYNKSMLSMVLVLIPTMIIGIILCFASWLPTYSFGTIIFWGMLVMALYNISITKILFLSTIKTK